MHWLQERLAHLATLAPEPGADRAVRARFLDEVSGLVASTAALPGVEGVFASLEGLLVAAAGAPAADAEAMAALAQISLQATEQAEGALGLGEVQQLVLVGRTRKLALMRVGALTFGLRAPAGVQLGRVTAEAPAA